jgi:hypothetical protein
MSSLLLAEVAESVQRLGYGLDDRGSMYGRGRNGYFSLCHHFQTESGGSFSLSNGSHVFFLRDKAARA